MKEFFLALRIAHAISKEVLLQTKLIKHRSRMIDLGIHCIGSDFKNPEAKKWHEMLKERIVSRFE